MVMIRKQLYLPASLDRELAAEAKRRGISQAELIRMRLEGGADNAIRRRTRTPAQEARRKEALEALEAVRRRTKPGPGTGRKFNRQELYAERLERVSPR
jgi:Ribbon-helix-helix protein, copG family